LSPANPYFSQHFELIQNQMRGITTACADDWHAKPGECTPDVLECPMKLGRRGLVERTG
jgi:hypothetical protein